MPQRSGEHITKLLSENNKTLLLAIEKRKKYPYVLFYICERIALSVLLLFIKYM